MEGNSFSKTSNFYHCGFPHCPNQLQDVWHSFYYQIPVPEIVASFFGGLKPITHVFKPLKSQTSWEGLYLFILQTFISHHLKVGIKTWDGLSVLMGCHQYGGILRGLPIFLCLHHVDSAGSNFDSSYLIEITQFQQCIQEQGMCLF